MEQLYLNWFQSIGYDIAPDSSNPEHSDYRQVIFHDRLIDCLAVINPAIPANTLEQVAIQITKPEPPILINNNKAFHQWLLESVKVEFEDANGKQKIDYVQLVDFGNPDNNQFWWLTNLLLLVVRATATRLDYAEI